MTVLLETERLLLRAFDKAGDAELLAQLDADPHVLHHVGDPAVRSDRAEALRRYEAQVLPRWRALRDMPPWLGF